MADIYVNFWDNGAKKWILKEQVNDSVILKRIQAKDSINNIGELLLGCDVKSNLKKRMIYIKRTNYNIYEFMINSITSVTLLSNKLIIESEDGVPTVLNFISESESYKAQQRILFILNGFEIINCNDERVFDCRPSNNVSVVFK